MRRATTLKLVYATEKINESALARRHLDRKKTIKMVYAKQKRPAQTTEKKKEKRRCDPKEKEGVKRSTNDEHGRLFRNKRVQQIAGEIRKKSNRLAHSSMSMGKRGGRWKQRTKYQKKLKNKKREERDAKRLLCPMKGAVWMQMHEKNYCCRSDFLNLKVNKWYKEKWTMCTMCGKVSTKKRQIDDRIKK